MCCQSKPKRGAALVNVDLWSRCDNSIQQEVSSSRQLSAAVTGRLAARQRRDTDRSLSPKTVNKAGNETAVWCGSVGGNTGVRLRTFGEF